MSNPLPNLRRQIAVLRSRVRDLERELATRCTVEAERPHVRHQEGCARAESGGGPCNCVVRGMLGGADACDDPRRTPAW